MAKVISIHEYVLRPDTKPADFEAAIQKAEERGLLKLPGLVAHQFVRGIRGSRRGQYAAIWVYESKEAWERLWGSEVRPRDKRNYPKNWKVWETEVLAPFLSQDPDRITFTAYEEVKASA